RSEISGFEGRPRTGRTPGRRTGGHHVSESETIYAYYPVFRAERDAPPEGWHEASLEAERLLKEWADRVIVRGVYSTAGLRADADLMMWWVTPRPDLVQELRGEFRRSSLGRSLDLVWAFMGLVRPAEFTPDHAPAF